MRFPFPLLALGSLLMFCAVIAPRSHAAGGAAAEPSPLERSEVARARYPQPVRVGDLAGRQVLEDTSQQGVLGRVAAVTRDPAGQVSIVMDRGGLFGFGARRVAVPSEAMALLGQYLVLKDLDAAAIAALPSLPALPAGVLPAEATIRIGLTRN